jgi:2-polyprenyl-3-methyl-5-hydroxy-6-metoxy-1,4-benzoquinol methylase
LVKEVELKKISYSTTIIPRSTREAVPAIKEYEQIYPYLPGDPNARIIEIGAGGGDFILFMLEKGSSNITGIDSDQAAIDYAKSRGLENLICADALDYLASLQENSVDAIVMNNVIEHFDKKNLMRILALIYDKLRSGGIFIAKTGNIENPLNLGLYLRDFTHEVGFTKSSLRQVLIMCGFDQGGVEVHNVKFRSANIVKQLVINTAGGVVALTVKIAAKLMGCRIDSMARLIFCAARK